MFDHRPINWKLISSAIDFYQSRGFTYLEVPWIVAPTSTDVTTPPGKRALSTDIGNLVGSAEQSFIELMRTENLTGCYVAASPCFRDEKSDIHQPYFFKVELFKRHKSTVESSACLFATHATAFFLHIGAEATLTKTQEGYDILLNGVEIGSYGVRQHEDMVWTYGTGIAEPRFSYALGLNQKSQ